MISVCYVPLFLGHCSVDGYGGEVLLDQKLSQGHASLDGLHKDDDLQTRQIILKRGTGNMRNVYDGAWRASDLENLIARNMSTGPYFLASATGNTASTRRMSQSLKYILQKQVHGK